jgi:NAD(P)H-dependent flavin oxidoreductase YrpB (nitropropane dioxygenase family)
MTKFKEVLGSKYPIVAMAMNQVSDINLAIAVRKAGAIPSLSIFNYFDNPARIVHDLELYHKEFNDYKLLLSLNVFQLVSSKFLNLITKYRIEFLEIIPDMRDEFPDHNVKLELRNSIIESLSFNGVKIFVKRNQDIDIPPHIAGIILKGKEGAGRGIESTEALFERMSNKYPHLDIIVSGGIGTADHIKHYMDRGALAVGIGTLLTTAEECSISQDTKMKLVSATSKEITRFNSGATQNAIVFKELEQDDFNHTTGLAQGIRNPNTGHVFAGTAIDHVTEIKPVAEIIKTLIRDYE